MLASIAESPGVTHGNHLVARLSLQDRRLLLAVGKHVRLVPGAVLFERGEDDVAVYFPTDGAVLLSVPAHATPGLGVLLVGREGMLGMHRVLGSGRSTLRAVVQTSGDALQIDATVFSVLLTGNLTLHRALLTYVGAIVNQVAASAACSRFHGIGPRLAGWLLMTRERGSTESFHMPQDSLALMLGVRRVGVTLAANALQRLRLIDYRRGDITVLDVPGLRAVAGQCYVAGPVAQAAIKRPRRSRQPGLGQPAATQSP
jgi:CRP-like cAMP-binding protein